MPGVTESAVQLDTPRGFAILSRTNDQRRGQADERVTVEPRLQPVELTARKQRAAIILLVPQTGRSSMVYVQVGVALSMIFASAAASNSTTPTAKNSPVKTASTDQGTKYCVESEPFTGSMISKTECKTRAEWAKEGVDVDQLKKH
jgi:hypothetical protein